MRRDFRMTAESRKCLNGDRAQMLTEEVRVALQRDVQQWTQLEVKIN